MTRWRRIGDGCERVMAAPAGFAGFMAVTLLLLVINATAANLFISIATAALVLVQLAGARAGLVAVQAKLDELIAAASGARDALLRAEEQDEAAIVELRR